MKSLFHQPETILREINTLIAYGKYDSTEKLLQVEIEKSPTNKLLHIRLLEFYAEANKVDEFKQHLQKTSQLLNSDSEFGQHVEKIYQQAWNEPLKASF